MTNENELDITNLKTTLVARYLIRIYIHARWAPKYLSWLVHLVQHLV